ncbi:WD-40 repeat-containing protein [Crinalium epipsammum PCC 9333]|uniref:WD-40 repeat-containing protein n=1 Tax=Crinalium epipsammum PCC 9333 TaxID=1173022 RepID=K9W4X6_9CYAN|nr:caspase family protein [Crinalium epipsammum]AFZ15246.1 WD-40 repeat-containing protein [Crinalium epipsammum PCC 9333]
MSPVSIATSRSTQALETGQPKLWLLMVGVNKYQDQTLHSLRYSSVDCQGLAEALLEATQGFAQKEIKIYHDFAPELPYLKTVRASLKQISTAAKSQDTILCYFSGHGMLEPNTQQAYLCLADTQKDNLFNTGLALQELLELLGNCAAHQQLVWLDACHSGGMTLRGITQTAKAEPLLNPASQLVEVLQQRANKTQGFYALLSCDQGQQSWEFPELGHGVFTYYLMRGLRGEAADAQGRIDVDSLYRYVYHQTLQYIDKTNQQLRLINQQKRHKGETQLNPEYPLQSPKRIVEGIGELILGSTPTYGKSRLQRTALVVEGLTSSKITLEFSKVLRGIGGFALEYLPRPGKTTVQDVREAIQKCLRVAGKDAGELLNIKQQYNTEEPTTALLYLRGHLAETEADEAVLLLGEDIIISRSWLRQQLRRSQVIQQIIILDCIDIEQTSSLKEWVEDLQLDAERGQCIIAASPSDNNSEKFAQALLDTIVAPQSSGLSIACWITQLQVFLADAFPLHIWLSGAQGVIEVLPGKTAFQNSDKEGLDLGICPYKGLRAFGEEDAQYFYGRENLTQQLINQVAHKSFLAVVGASGSGKSSVVQAGLIAKLRQGKQFPGSDKWFIRKVTPGIRPLEALSRRLVEGGIDKEKASLQALQIEGMLYQGVEGFVYWIRSRPESMVVLVIDQFEELFTLAPSEDRQRFLELILGAVEYAADKFKLIITLRTDFIAACLEVPKLAMRLQQSNVLVPPKLTADDYRRVIVNPAEQVGLKVANDLVEVLLQELNHSAGDLPLLEFVLEQLWEYRSQGELTLQAYQEQVGGIKGALEQKAQAVYESLDAQAKECARWIFLSLTQLGEGTEDTRRRVFKSDLVVKKYQAALVDRTLQALIAAKLVVVSLEDESRTPPPTHPRPRGGEQEDLSSMKSPSPGFPQGGNELLEEVREESVELSLEVMKQQVTVEVAHEILIRHWSTLRWWLEENRARLRSQRQIAQAALQWKHSGKQSDFLLQGVRLAEAEDIYIKYTDELSADVQEFIAACLEQRQQKQFEQKKRLRQAQKAVVAISVLAIAASGFGGLAYWHSQTAQLREIDALNSSSQANLLLNNQLEALIASVKAAKRLNKTIAIPANLKTETVSTLQQVVTTIQERDRLNGHTDSVISVNYSPDNQLIASASLDKTVKLWSNHGLLLTTLRGHSEAVYSVSFSPDNKILASAGVDKTIKLWNVSDRRLLKTISGHNQTVNSVNFSPDGKIIASSSADQTIKLWQVSDGRLLKTLSGHNAGVISINFSPDGNTIASASEDKIIKLWQVSDAKLLKILTGHTNWVNSVTFNPDGKLIASAGADKTIKLWNSSDGKLIRTISGHNDSVWGVRFSPDSKNMISASRDNTIKLWNLNGIEVETFKGHKKGVYSVSFSPDGKNIASASLDNTIKIWQRRESSLLEILTSGSGVYGASFSPQGDIVASATAEGAILLWRRSDGKFLKTLTGHNKAIYSVSFNPQGNLLASASEDKTVKVWNINHQTLLYTLKGHSDEVNSASFSFDGKMIATASRDRTVKLWDSNNGKLIHTLKGHSDEVYKVSFSPDSETIVTASADKTIKVWNSRTGNLIKSIPAHKDWIYSVNFSPDGKFIASTSADKTIKLWRSSDYYLLHTFKGHQAEVYSSSFAPDSQTFTSASEDKTIKIWQIDGTLLKTIPAHSAAVMSVNFSLDGKSIISGSLDNTAKIWSFDRQQLQASDQKYLMQRACNWLHDYLKTNSQVSRDERKLCSS